MDQDRITEGNRPDIAETDSLRDILIAQGAPVLADIIMRGSQDSPSLAEEVEKVGRGAQVPARRRNIVIPRLAEVRARAEKEAVAAALERCEFNITRTAAHLGISRVTLYNLMYRYGIRR